MPTSPQRPRSLCLPAATRPLALLALTGITACGSAASMPPVAYRTPVPGTVYDYGTFTNRITAVDGWRTSYVDDRGREGRRVALFITEDPRRPLVVDSVAVDSLWPLRLGHGATVLAHQGEEVYRWEFRVLDTTTVTVPAGTFRTIVVEGTQLPELVRVPQAATSAVHTWWYGPTLGAVVRFRSVYLTGPSAGRRFEGELRAIRAPGAADSAAAQPETGPAADSGAAGGAPPRA
ncbi:MAG TPA: hypothetical protein VFS08_15295 [Gemmatimonadaceae bacterium]|nr:hypothetical protein [Gemmatimonadaceae bacterium]